MNKRKKQESEKNEARPPFNKIDPTDALLRRALEPKWRMRDLEKRVKALEAKCLKNIKGGA